MVVRSTYVEFVGMSLMSASVPAIVGSVIKWPLEFNNVLSPNVGLFSVLLVSVSVVARPTSVSVLVGSVSVPVFVMDDMTGDALNVLMPLIVCGLMRSTYVVFVGISLMSAIVPAIVGKVIM